MKDRTTLGIVCLCVLAIMSGGCGSNQGPTAAPPLPVVPVSQPVTRDVTDYVDFTGRTDAIDSVGIRARVTGYLVKIPFKEGTEVKKDDLLFEIDPRPYQAQLDQAKSQVALNEAQLKLAKAIYARDVALANKNAISQQELDQDLASVEEAEARVNASKASLEVYKLNLAFTKVTSPINGKVSRYYLTLGNLVVQDQTLLTTVVSLDPMYAYFDVDEPTLLMIRKAINAGKIELPKEGADIPVLMGLQGEEGYPHPGTVNFVNNVVNPSTGTISVRGVFPNPKPKEGTRLLSPGMFVRIRLPIGRAHPALLVIDRAVGSDQGLKFVYVLTADNKIEYRRVKTGPLQDDGLRVIEDGLKAGDWVVVGALQQVRPNMQVSPERMPMPTLGHGEGPAGVPNRPQPPPPGQQGAKGQGNKRQ
jgi:RND family efflux transporter MFP subunit